MRINFSVRRLKNLKSDVRKVIAVGLICATCNIAFAQQGYYPPPQQGYPPQQQGYYPPPQQGYYPPPQQGYYPPPQQGYYPPAQASANANSNTIVVNSQPAYPQQPYGQAYPNFTPGERWGTWAINWLIPGLGSFVIMKDVTGGIVQIVLYVGGIICLANSVSTEQYSYYDPYYSYTYGYYYDDYYGGYRYGYHYEGGYDYYNDTYLNAAFYIGLGLLVANFVYNIVRSSTYKKPPPPQRLYGSAENVGLKVTATQEKRGTKTRFAYSTNF